MKFPSRQAPTCRRVVLHRHRALRVQQGIGLYDLVTSTGGASLVSGSSTAAVPEPMSALLTITGAAGMLIARRERDAWNWSAMNVRQSASAGLIRSTR